MAHSNITLKHPTFGTIKSAPVGFSWTTALMGIGPALLRGDFKWAGIIGASTLVTGIAVPFFGLIMCWIIFGLIYNKMYIKELVDKGYRLEAIESTFSIEQLEAQLEVVLTDKPGSA